jgi:hypothetical protein
MMMAIMENKNTAEQALPYVIPGHNLKIPFRCSPRNDRGVV